MSNPPHAEFAQFRFVRNAEGGMTPLPSRGTDERCLLVMDCLRWGMARLHIFEAAARRADVLEAFQGEFERISELRDEAVTRLVSWGRDGEELFYADVMHDGEPLPDYLDRTGGVPFPVAAEWIVRWLEFLEAAPADLPSFQRYSTLNFQVVLDRAHRVRPLFSEFSGWTKPGSHVREHAREWYAAQVFCSLLAGVPVRTFDEQDLPRNFDDLDTEVKGAVLDALRDGATGAAGAFEEAMRALSSGVEEARSSVARPVMPVREWLRRELAVSYPGAPDFELPETFDQGEERYAVPTTVRGNESHIQLLPGPECLPREGWLNQHHDATRRPGRPLLNQLHVNYIEDRGSVTLIGEEKADGVDLAALVLASGLKPPELAARIVRRIDEAIQSLERRVGACLVWWLPPENVFLLTGTRSLSGSLGLVERAGESAWEDLSWKLRLHQTSTTMREGVLLPRRIRELSGRPGKKYEPARRGAVGLPIAFFLLTGRQMRWRRPLDEQAALPDELLDFLEGWRQRLSDDPESVEESFADGFTSTVSSRESWEEKEIADELPKENGFEEMLDSALYDGEVSIGEEAGELQPPGECVIGDPSRSEPVEPVEAGETEGAGPAEDGAEGEARDGTPGRKASRWKFWSTRNLWIAVWALVLALVVGYLLAGWNERRGGVEVAGSPRFPRADYRAPADPGIAETRARLESFLVARVRPELIGAARSLEIGENREEIEAALDEFIRENDAEAAGLRALLALSGEAGEEEITSRLERAARLGDASSQFVLAKRILVEGRAGAGRTEAAEWLRRAAAVGDANSQELLGGLLVLQELEGADPSEARQWIDRAVGRGSVPATYQSGLLHANGIGGPADPAAAARCFRRAAEQGDERAMFALGRCLESGFGVEPSFTEARLWMKKAAALGHGPAGRWCEARGVELAVNGE